MSRRRRDTPEHARGGHRGGAAHVGPVHRLHLLQRHLRPLLLLLLRSLALGNHLLHGHLLLVLPALLLERLLLRLEGRLGTARGRRGGAHEVLGSHQTARGGLNVRAHVAICDLHRRREEPAELLILGARDVHLLDRLGEGVIVLHFATELAEHVVVRGAGAEEAAAALSASASAEEAILPARSRKSGETGLRIGFGNAVSGPSKTRGSAGSAGPTPHQRGGATAGSGDGADRPSGRRRPLIRRSGKKTQSSTVRKRGIGGRDPAEIAGAGAHLEASNLSIALSLSPSLLLSPFAYSLAGGGRAWRVCHPASPGRSAKTKNQPVSRRGKFLLAADLRRLSRTKRDVFLF